MNYPSDSTYSTPPVGDTGNNASAVFLDQVYPGPASGVAGGDTSMYTNQTFAPPSTADSLPPLTLEPETPSYRGAGAEPAPQAPFDASSGQRDRKSVV